MSTRLFHSAVLAAALTTGCIGAPEPETTSELGSAPPPSGYHFQLSQQGRRIDAVGISLLSTLTLGRDDRYMQDIPNNQLWLPKIGIGLMKLHVMWGDDLRAAGYETCATQLPDLLPDADLEALAVGCTFQKVNGRKVIEVFNGDHLEIDFNQPAGFPNGRRPQDQINNQFPAVGLLKIGSRDPYDPNGGPVTLDSLQHAAERYVASLATGQPIARPPCHPPYNDVPFPLAFPYLAEAHPMIAAGDLYDSNYGGTGAPYDDQPYESEGDEGSGEGQ